MITWALAGCMAPLLPLFKPVSQQHVTVTLSSRWMDGYALRENCRGAASATSPRGMAQCAASFSTNPKRHPLAPAWQDHNNRPQLHVTTPSTRSTVPPTPHTPTGSVCPAEEVPATLDYVSYRGHSTNAAYTESLLETRRYCPAKHTGTPVQASLLHTSATTKETGQISNKAPTLPACARHTHTWGSPAASCVTHAPYKHRP